MKGFGAASHVRDAAARWTMANYTLLEYIYEDNREYIDEKGLQRMRLGGSAPSR